MATQPLRVQEGDPAAERVETTRQREKALSRMVMTYISTGLFFMLLPGTFLGVWNLLSISAAKEPAAVSPAWIQAHGHAQVFGWIGCFILGIGFYSIPKMRRAQAFALWEAWVCWGMWTSGVLLRWFGGVYQWHWRVAVALSAGLELLAFLIFFRTVSSHRPAASADGVHTKLERWIFVVIAGTVGWLATLIANLGESVNIALHASSPAFAASFDARFLALMAWGFMVPFVWGFSARWLPTFLGLREISARALMLVVAMNAAGVLFALAGLVRVAVFLLLAAAVGSWIALRLAMPPIKPAKTQGVHSSFPYFVRLAYGWLIVAAALGIWAAFAQHSEGIWGASRHALTVGFIATMVFAIGQRVLPAFGGMRRLYSPKLMGLNLGLLSFGCLLRVSSEALAYQGTLAWAWKSLPVSAVIELTAVTLFAANMIGTFLSRPLGARLAHIEQACRRAV
jgi:hypothetical protein